MDRQELTLHSNNKPDATFSKDKKTWLSPYEDSHSLPFVSSLSLLDSIVGTNRSAAAAADAGVGINLVDLALGDSLYRANRNTCSACHAAVCNYISHNFSFLKFRLVSYAKLMVFCDSANYPCR